MGKLETTFCGKTFVNPFTISASPSSDSREKVERALEAGWGGIVFKTTALKEHSPVLAEPNMAGIPYGGKPQFGFYNIDLISERTIEEIQEDIVYFKRKYPDRILIGSIMASSQAQWEKLVGCLEDAGADMIECSMSCPQGEQSIATEGEKASNVIPATDRELMKTTTATIKRAVKKSTPAYIKMTPNVTDIVDVASGALEGGANGLCAIDTVRGFIGVDIETGYPKLNIKTLSTWGGLSGPIIKPIALGCVSKLAKSFDIPVAGVGGISNWKDAVEFLLLGASNIQICTAISRYGFGMIKDLCAGLEGYMDRKGYHSVQDMIGSSLRYLVDHADLDRANHLHYHADEEECIKCGACAVACQDAGFGALTFTRGEYPHLDDTICRGCGLCTSVCPKDCITLR